jgi:hypothetical protein
VAVLDATGSELASHPGPAVRLFGSRFDEIGYATQDKVWICKLTPQPVWTEVDVEVARPQPAPGTARPPFPIDFAFRGHELDIYGVCKRCA